MSLWSATIEPVLRAIDPEGFVRGGGRVEAAMRLSEQHYAGRKHWTSESLLEHTLGVLVILLPFKPDEDTIVACLLQHTLELQAMTLLELEEQCGSGVCSLVSGVHLLSRVPLRTRRSSVEDLRVMLLSISDDVRVLLIILCDYTYVLGHQSFLPPRDRTHLCRDALNIFAPVAARLGIHSLKQRLESLAFPVVYPQHAQWVSQQLEEVHARHGHFLPSAAELLSRRLQEHGLEATVEGREKQPYSIFRKMKMKTLSHIDKLHDLFALRIVVRTPEECYRALGVLHRLGRPVANRFKDYIAFPKPNHYQSLHTTIVRLPGVPEGVLTEVQVRTLAMHREAEYGIAAHWSYKEGGTSEQAMRRIELQQILTSQHAVKAEGSAAALADHIFVLTPKGDIIELPEGATPLDFAFQIHTDIGLGFRAARVNGNIAPLDYELENGDIVEILMHATPRPSLEWLQRLKMASSRARLKRHLRLSSFAVPSFPQTSRTRLKKTDEERMTELPPAARVEVEGGLSMPVKLAKCCKPLHDLGENIVGVVSRRSDVTVHRSRCHMIRQANPGRRIVVKWRETS